MESLVLFLPFLLIMGGFMYFASRRQRRAMQATIDLHESLEPGDRVHTTSGMEATVVGITDDTVDLEIAPGVVTTWMKLAIRDRILPDTDEDLDDDTDEDLDEERAHPDDDEQVPAGDESSATKES
ncbi:preprotein translocase subunit YajC [Mycobacterium kansasii]|uniref:Preprotein translocase subunit YajC n=3 Tax=Mycobacterium kansasii TaxID=1768 RepID=A0A653EJ33_MYCKA|nr:preprotein translocase subunit YajC [Mycobacterium kansasii]ARG54993.1 preprotein translocase subunit YajC [Mycobacterium kansasii]ARG60444.1 preprotein translocase subunit YajC [Mycobacterium kansasii]ARG68126.1 preprotein translocase subunit YajC [Mycobacterium kansasii]ARG78545.1 preprotein translocase subunit YajC [Mycobacterium kansasii]ARG84010.1 preprotein translocase subunit YajC [Mycobacterium kansasii]